MHKESSSQLVMQDQVLNTKHKCIQDWLHTTVQKNSNKRCMLSYLSYIVILMRVIYYLSLVLRSYSVLHKSLLYWGYVKEVEGYVEDTVGGLPEKFG
jgi:hypothetical protein